MTGMTVSRFIYVHDDYDIVKHDDMADIGEIYTTPIQESMAKSKIQNVHKRSFASMHAAFPRMLKSLPAGARELYRCMIQDILGNEIYTEENPEKFRDRTIYYCITIPGENDWVRGCSKGNKNEFMTNYPLGFSTKSSSTTSPSKDLSESQENGDEAKNYRLSFSLVNSSYPIPSDGKNKACLIKVYDSNLVEHLRVNDIVHVSGLVEPNEFEDNSQLVTNKSSPGGGHTGDDINAVFEDGFEPASDFPHRLVPRVHVKALKKLNHINPLLPDIITRDQIDVTSVKLSRAKLSTIFTQLFGGDSLAAEYMILSLISRIHRRKDVSNLGQFSIGLSGFKPEMKFLIDKLYEIIAKITTHSHYIDMSIANLNSLRFTPQKDHDNNKMIAGTLQLPDGLYLLLNETALSEGQLTEQGTMNLNTINQIIRWQRLSYNFKFHSVDIETDLKLLVISEGKSILTVPYTVRIEKNDPETISSMREACVSVNDFLTEDLLNMFRYFITSLKDVPEYNIPDELQKSIQEDFCRWRQEDDKERRTLFSADDLSSYMTLARYLTISRGETQLTPEIWKETRRMETERQSRLLRSV